MFSTGRLALKLNCLKTPSAALPVKNTRSVNAKDGDVGGERFIVDGRTGSGVFCLTWRPDTEDGDCFYSALSSLFFVARACSY